MQQAVPEVALTVPAMITNRAEELFAERAVVSRVGDGFHRSTWGEVVHRARRLATALRELGVGPGDRVATFAGSTHRHVEAYLAVPSMGCVLHTVNTSLPAEQVAYIVDHADDAIVLCDRSLLADWRAAEAHMSRARRVIVLPDVPGDDGDGDGTLDYEELLAAARPLIAWPEVAESAPAHTSYTTGTTGRPKGVVYSHRSTVLQSFCTGLADAEGLSSSQTLLPLVPLGLSQVGLPFAAALHGSALVLPGRDLTPAGVCELVEKENPSIAVWFGAALTGLLRHYREHHPDLSSLKRMVCGGSPVARPVSLAFEEEVGVPIVQVFGMTETSGHGSFSRLPAEAGDDPSEEERAYYATSQGRPLPLVEMRIADDSGTGLAWDGRAMGELQVRGPWVARAYSHEGSPPDKFMDGWLRTGDVAVIDRRGYVRIVDRMKDLVKSDGEWISSLRLEEHLLDHAAVAEAAVVAVPDQDSGERPLACVVLKDAHDGEAVTEEELRAFLAARVAASWVPRTIALVPALPKTSIGKIDKKTLRARYADERA